MHTPHKVVSLLTNIGSGDDVGVVFVWLTDQDGDMLDTVSDRTLQAAIYIGGGMSFSHWQLFNNCYCNSHLTPHSLLVTYVSLTAIQTLGMVVDGISIEEKPAIATIGNYIVVGYVAKDSSSLATAYITYCDTEFFEWSTPVAVTAASSYANDGYNDTTIHILPRGGNLLLVWIHNGTAVYKFWTLDSQVSVVHLRL